MSLDPLTRLRRPGPEPKRDWREHVAATVRELEQFRGAVHQRLDSLEQVARQRAEGEGPDQAAATEELSKLRRRVAELESAKERLEIEASSWRAERSALLEQLEHDRRQLAEAWEAVERDRIQNPASYQQRAPERPQPQAELAPPPPGPTGPPPAAPPPRRPAGADDDLVAQEILRQFQTLRRDVRRTSHDNRRD